MSDDFHLSDEERALPASAVWRSNRSAPRGVVIRVFGWLAHSF
jgi:hypothetical protein